MRTKTHIISVFTQIEEVVASAMVEEGKGHKIPLDQFPRGDNCMDIWFNEAGEKAKFAVMLRDHQLREFNQRVALLRA